MSKVKKERKVKAAIEILARVQLHKFQSLKPIGSARRTITN